MLVGVCFCLVLERERLVRCFSSVPVDANHLLAPKLLLDTRVNECISQTVALNHWFSNCGVRNRSPVLVLLPLLVEMLRLVSSLYAKLSLLGTWSFWHVCIGFTSLTVVKVWLGLGLS